MMKELLNSDLLQELFGTKEIGEIEVIQTLWSGYGEINRVSLIGGNVDSVIVKNISFPTQQNHPRGWNTNRSHNRKVKSYQVESAWYKQWAHRCEDDCRVPKCYQSITNGDEHLLILEDLDGVGYPVRKSWLDVEEVQLGLNWLANFHATFLNESPDNLWQEGTYWHLATRPDEFEAMEPGKHKDMATQLDQALSRCQFQTIVHGDAKVANFCFSEDMTQVAALDFQYFGGGCGMKDVIYFLGSCLDEEDCEQHETEFLNYYFSALKNALDKQDQTVDFNQLETEWRSMYAVSWADFTRFLLGWMPTHQKINSYSLQMIERAMVELGKH